jgi:hypothetical protein
MVVNSSGVVVIDRDVMPQGIHGNQTPEPDELHLACREHSLRTDHVG